MCSLRAAIPLLVCALGSGVIACQSFIDVDRFASGDAREGGISFDACGEAAVCLPTLPLGWSGPVVMVEESVETACGETFPTEILRGDDIVDLPELTCSCACSAPAGQTCPNPRFQNFSSTDCTPATNGSTLATGSCTSSFSPSPPPGGSVRVDAGTATGGSCTPLAEEGRPPIEAERRIVCGGASLESEGCRDGAACLPIPSGGFEPRLCIWAEGEVPCPTGAGFAETRTLYRDGYVDERTCSPCTCEPPSEGTCEGTSAIFSNSQCNNKKADLPHDGTCVMLSPPGFASVQLQESKLIPGTCEASLVVVAGEVLRRDPVTVCCTPSLE